MIPVLLGVISILLVRFFDIPLQFGFFSLSLGLAFVLTVVAGPLVAILSLLLALLWRRPRPREVACDLFPAALLSLGLYAAPHPFPSPDPLWLLAFFLALVPLPVVLRHQFGGSDQADFAALQWEWLALGGLGPLSCGLWLFWKPGLLLLPLLLLGLRASAQRGLQLSHFRAGRVDMRQQRRGLAQQELAVEERAQGFLMLETLSLACKTQEQALQEVLGLIQRRFPNCSCAYESQGEILLTRGPEPGAGCPVQSYPLGSASRLNIYWREQPTAEVLQSLQVILRYTSLLLERAEFQEHLLQSIQSLSRLLSAAVQLGTEISAQDIQAQALLLAQELCGQPVRRQPDGSFIASAPLSPTQEQALSLWSHLVSGVLERNQQQSQLLQAGKLAAIGQLAAGVAHELNTPLGSLTLALSSAQQSWQSRPERAQARMQQALKAAQQMQGIVSKLLHYARESGTGFQRVQLREVAEDSLQMIGYQLESQGLQVLSELEPAEVKGDPGQLQQVVLNLLSNACQSNAGGGWVRIELRVEGEIVRLRVSDSGPGVPQEVCERIFEPFFTTREVGQGTGLGLSLSRQIAEQHGGTLLWLKGSIFELSLPTWN